MALSLPATIELIKQQGFYHIGDIESALPDAKEAKEGDLEMPDRTKGRKFQAFYKDYYTKSPMGLEFVFKNTIGDPFVSKVVTSIIRDPIWGYVRAYSSTVLGTKYAWFFHRPSDTNEAIHTLLVQLWLPGSKAIFYQKSQLRNLKVTELKDFGLLSKPCSEMTAEGFQKISKDMPLGGYRLGFACEKGDFMVIGLTTKDELAYWAPMKFPGTEPLRAKARELEGRGFRTNIVFGE